MNLAMKDQPRWKELCELASVEQDPHGESPFGRKTEPIEAVQENENLLVKIPSD
jgi:hypothetical protein